MSAATYLRVVPAPAPVGQQESLSTRREQLRAELAAIEEKIAERFPITSRQRELLVFVSNYQALNEGRSPSMAQIRDALGVRSFGTVAKHLDALEEKGAIERGNGKWRAIKLRRAF